MEQYIITPKGEEYMRKIGDVVSREIEPAKRFGKKTSGTSSLIRNLQNEQYILAKLYAVGPLTRPELVSYGAPETHLHMALNNLMQEGCVERV